jgi:hypothetical protein
MGAGSSEGSPVYLSDNSQATHKRAVVSAIAADRGRRGAAFLSARNDAIGNVAIIVAGRLTSATRSPSPDLIVGLGIFLMKLGAAREVFLVFLAAQRDLSKSRFTRVSVATQFTSQVVPPSSENACSN